MTSNLVTYSNVCDCFYDFFVYLIDTVRDPWWGWLGQACKTKCIGCSGEYSYTVVQLMSTPLLWYSTGNVAFPACSCRAFGGGLRKLLDTRHGLSPTASKKFIDSIIFEGPSGKMG